MKKNQKPNPEPEINCYSFSETGKECETEIDEPIYTLYTSNKILSFSQNTLYIIKNIPFFCLSSLVFNSCNVLILKEQHKMVSV